MSWLRENVTRNKAIYMHYSYLLGCFISLVFFCAPIQAQWYSYSGEAMTTAGDLQFWNVDAAEIIGQAVFEEFHAIIAG